MCQSFSAPSFSSVPVRQYSIQHTLGNLLRDESRDGVDEAKEYGDGLHGE
jgi:hypothetical protein